MAISDLKMKDADFTGKQVTDLSDNPSEDGVSATDLKEMFVAPSKRVVLPAFNALIELLAGSEGAANIGATQINGLSGYTVQDILEAIKALLDTKKPTETVDKELAQKFDKKEAQALVKNIEFNESTGVFTITKYDGTVQTYDTALEKVALNCRLEGQQFVLTLVDGTEQRVDLSAFLTQTEVKSSNTITLAITNGAISAQLVAGSIKKEHLSDELTEYIEGKEASATASATEAGVQAENARLSALSAEASKNAAKISEGNAKNSEDNTKASETNAKTSETNAAKSAEQAAKAAGEATGAVAKAMQEAKDSGAFDGKNGTSVSVKNVSESTADGGSNVVTFSDGKTVTIKNGSKGSKGNKGDKGDSYILTENDKNEISALAAILLKENSVIGFIDESNNIVLSGNLADGTYTLQYENADGTYTDAVSMVVGEAEGPTLATFTNLFDASTALLNQRISLSAGTATALDGHVATVLIDVSNKIPFTADTKIYIKGGDLERSTDGNYRACIISYKNKTTSDYTNHYSQVTKGSSIVVLTDEGNGVLSISNIAGTMCEGVTHMAVVLRVKDTAITEDDIKDIIITIDEPIYLS